MHQCAAMTVGLQVSLWCPDLGSFREMALNGRAEHNGRVAAILASVVTVVVYVPIQVAPPDPYQHCLSVFLVTRSQNSFKCMSLAAKGA